jgi:NAD(P)-dependent dehydrogenase (short-subunit alcohol dehydrogenase family)
MSNTSLEGRIAVVTGASRGAGRAIAVELGAAGATVYVTGRTTRAAPTHTYATMLEATGMTSMPGTIDDTAEAVSRAGGLGIAVRCDHTQVEEVHSLFARVEREHGRLDLLVNNAWGAHETFAGGFGVPFWEQPLEHWDSMFARGVRNHVISSQHAAPLFVRQRSGLIVTTTFWDRDAYLASNFFYDLAKASMNRLAFAVAEELRPFGVSSLALSPGFMRTELVLAAMKTDEEHHAEVPALARTESPHYVGRAVVALAGDPDVISKSGRVLRVGDLAREYGFTDIDGSQPEPFELEPHEGA